MPHSTAAKADPGTQAFIARQPICDAGLAVVAYELLYRHSAEAVRAEVSDAREATLRVLATMALDIGLDRLAGTLPVHVNYPRELLLDPPPLPLEPARVVIEVLEDVPGDRQVLAGIARLRERGHRIALDDYVPGGCEPALLEQAHIVKIDIRQVAPADVARTVQELKHRRLTLVAEGVETVEEFERCIDCGFDAFQGHFLRQPQTIGGQRMPSSSRIGALRLLAALQSEEYSLAEVEQLLSQDLALSYRVLRCINSSYYNLPRRVDSIRQGIVILGADNLRRLCTLAVLLGLEGRPPSLLIAALVRARMCENLGRLGAAADSGPYFITGLFSMLEALLGIPEAQAVAELPLAPAVERALVQGEGDLGAALHCVRAYEQGLWDRVSYRGLEPAVIRAAYLDAVFWADETRAMLSG